MKKTNKVALISCLILLMSAITLTSCDGNSSTDDTYSVHGAYGDTFEMYISVSKNVVEYLTDDNHERMYHNGSKND
jgi:hypothetical protein